MQRGSTIINCSSVNHYIGRGDLLDYTSTKGAIVAFTRGLSNQQISKGIRVNCVCPGPSKFQFIHPSINNAQRADPSLIQSGPLLSHQQCLPPQWSNLAQCQLAVQGSQVKLLHVLSFSPVKTAASSLANACTRMVASWLMDR